MEHTKQRRKVWAIGCVTAGLVLMALSLCAWQVYAAAGREEAHILAGRRVLLDPGHGGSDGGTTGLRTGSREAEVNLDVALHLRDELQAMGAEVVMTREDTGAVGEDKKADMRKRRAMIETAGQDITVSIHQNSFPDPAVYGPQVIYAPGSEAGQALADCVQRALVAELRPERPRLITEGDYYIVKSGIAPAVIVECGFLSNEVEEALLLKEEYRARVAGAIARGIAEYLQKA